MNTAENFVYEVCRKSFLSLWSYVNPRGRDGNELCDVLVVCDPDVVILSVKEVGLTHSGDISVDWRRWQRRAIEESSRKIYGAERWIRSAPDVIRGDGTVGLPFPHAPSRRIHRVAVALGSEGRVPIYMGDLGKGFVHVFDETSFAILLRELDTIDDFVGYLSDKEHLLSSTQVVIEGSEEDLLAVYLHNNRTFPADATLIVIDDTLWAGFTSKDEVKAKRLADRDSYIWDNLIEMFSRDIMGDNLEFGPSLADAELVVRTMAREKRFSRRILGKSFKEFIELASQRKVRARIVKSSTSSVVYVFLADPHHEDRQARSLELANRCFVGRGLNPDSRTVVGVATERYELRKGYSLDSVYLDMEVWTPQDQAQMESIQETFRYFTALKEMTIHEDEHPGT